jgi:hypothetical protein
VHRAGGLKLALARVRVLLKMPATASALMLLALAGVAGPLAFSSSQQLQQLPSDTITYTS